MDSQREIIQVTASDISMELLRRGIASDERVTLTIEPEQELIPGRRESRAHVVAAGLSDDDIDQLIKQAQRDVEPTPQ
jgi:hypothetical protein